MRDIREDIPLYYGISNGYSIVKHPSGECAARRKEEHFVLLLARGKSARLIEKRCCYGWKDACGLY